MPYQPIENYAMIGDMHTMALVGLNGSIDWMCLPHFDSPSTFARILDDDKGGHFAIAPVDTQTTSKQFYWPDTNVLVTRFFTTQGAAELVDFMPVKENRPTGCDRQSCLIRRVIAVRGAVTFRLVCRPAFNYARDAHSVELADSGALFAGADHTLGLTSSVPLQRDGRQVVAEFTLRQGERAEFMMFGVDAVDNFDAAAGTDVEALFRSTVQYWRRWLSKSRYTGRWRETVHRSALALKLLTFEPTGAIVAAPTASLPEGIGGERNWDYRYTWIRDSAFTIYAFLRLGFTDEAAAFMNFLGTLCKRSDCDQPLQIMYGIDGRTTLTEETLDHLAGYRDSRPVHIGNGAYGQLQLDIYGELMDAAYIYNKHGAPISYDLWESLRGFVDWVCDNWQRTDEGVWEVRGGQQAFVYSKLMCWVAVDRGIRLADKRSFPADRARWQRCRDEIYEDIMAKGWSEQRQAFVQAYDSDTLDAANLMIPLVFFTAPTDPRMLKTLDATLLPPEEGGLVANSLVYRYNAAETTDGLAGEEGTFNICTFWLVEALTRAGQFDRPRLEEARLMFERMLGFANHVGLYAEETGSCGEALGNFPQAFTHLALISAAVNLDKALGSSA